MNTLVEKGLGIIIFVGLFVPYCMGLYVSYNKAGEFNNVTNELTQMAKEDGGIKGTPLTSAQKTSLKNTYNTAYNNEMNSLNSNNSLSKAEKEKKAEQKAGTAVDNQLASLQANNSALYNYIYLPVNTNNGRTTNSLVDRGYQISNVKVVSANGTTKNYDLATPSAQNIKFELGDKVTVSYDYKYARESGSNGFLGWNPHYEKATEFTVYKR